MGHQYPSHYRTEPIESEPQARSFLENSARLDPIYDHDLEKCGHCFHMWLMAEVARELLKERVYSISEWIKREQLRWRESKYFQLWQSETNAGRDPREAFKARGWEP